MEPRDFRPLTSNDIDAQLSKKFASDPQDPRAARSTSERSEATRGGYDGYFGCLTKENLVERGRWRQRRGNEQEYGVVNIDDDLSDETHGTHWVAFFHGKGNKYCYYFDSFGVTPDDTIKKFLKKRYRKKILYSQNILQDIDSALCGYYCVDWLKAMTAGVSFVEYLRNFGKDGHSNDKLLIERFYKSQRSSDP